MGKNDKMEQKEMSEIESLKKRISDLEAINQKLEKDNLLLEYRNTQLVKENASLREQNVLSTISEKYPEMLGKKGS